MIEYKTGTVRKPWEPYYDPDDIWIEEDCPKCGAQLYSWDSGQGCGDCCSECNFGGL